MVEGLSDGPSGLVTLAEDGDVALELQQPAPMRLRLLTATTTRARRGRYLLLVLST